MSQPTPPASPPEQLNTGAVWLLANPHAGSGRGETTAAAVKEALEGAGYRTVSDLSHPAVAEVPWKGTRPGPEWTVVVIGGDGTLRAAVARALEACGGDADAVPPILPVSMGTANLVGQYLDRPKSLLEIGLDGARSATAHATRQGLERFDAAVTPYSKAAAHVGHQLRDTIISRLEGPLHEHARRTAARVVEAMSLRRLVSLDVGDANGQLFLLMAGVGFDAHVVQVLDDRRSGPIGLWSYAIPALSAMTKFDFPPIRVKVDDARVFGPAPAVVIVANLPQYGIGVPLVPDARGNDRLLDVLVLPCASRLELARLLGLVALGQHLETLGAKVVRGGSVRVESERPVPVQIDGDPGGTLPLEATLRAGQIRLIAPPDPSKSGSLSPPDTVSGSSRRR